MNAAKIAQGEPGKIKLKRHSEVAELLNHLHDYYELSWPKIAQLPAINPADEEQIPISTLAKIAKTGIVPKKWRARFGVGAMQIRPPRTLTRHDQMKNAQTIRAYIDPEEIPLLIQYIQEGTE